MTGSSPPPSVPTSTPRIVLTMIVKNEAHVLERCIAAIRPVIDAWCIVDTGSTDGTQDLARRLLADLPGELHERVWQDFAHNRTEALALARPLGEYSLMIDADVVCEIDEPSRSQELRSQLTADLYDVTIIDGAIEYYRPLLTSTALTFGYRGVLHEALSSPAGAVAGGPLPGTRYRSRFDGARSQNPRKFLDDAALLESVIADGRDLDLLPRHTFYLAQSYRDAGMPDKALAVYEQRAAMTDVWVEERAVAWTWVGHLRRRLDEPVERVLDAYLHAFDCAPWRAEAMYHAANTARAADRLPTAYAFARAGFVVPRPERALFLEPDVYDWKIAYELCIAAYYANQPSVGAEACRRVLACPDVPAPERAAAEGNLAFY